MEKQCPNSNGRFKKQLKVMRPGRDEYEFHNSHRNDMSRTQVDVIASLHARLFFRRCCDFKQT